VREHNSSDIIIIHLQVSSPVEESFDEDGSFTDGDRGEVDAIGHVTDGVDLLYGSVVEIVDLDTLILL